MREIKFRSWLKEQEKFIYEFSMHIPNAGESEKNVLSQYTGLKDKNGREIYDQDILRVSNKSYERRAKVEWLQGRAKYVLVFDNLQVEQLDAYVTDVYEIIGNIHENPELLAQ